VAGLGSVFGRQRTGPAGDRFTAVVATYICGSTDVQSFQLEEQLALRTVERKSEHEVRYKTLPFARWKAGSS